MQERDEPVDLLRFVDRVAERLPQIPRLAILDAVEAEWDRLCAAAEPYLEPLVVPAVVWRLRTGPHAEGVQRAGRSGDPHGGGARSEPSD